MLAAAGAGGRYMSYSLAERTAKERRSAPAWVRPCSGIDPGPGEDGPCAHVEGRVAWIQRHDPDGDGDRHLVVVERFHVRLVKVRRSSHIRRLPSVGSRVEATGRTMRGASGRLEIVAQSLSS